MPRAVWNGAVLADSDDTVVVEGNHYFPRESLNEEHFRPSERTSRCFWKGQARYLTVVVDGQLNRDAAWYYPDPTAAARPIAGRVAFWHGVRIEHDGRDTQRSRFRRPGWLRGRGQPSDASTRRDRT